MEHIQHFLKMCCNDCLKTKKITKKALANLPPHKMSAQTDHSSFPLITEISPRRFVYLLSATCMRTNHPHHYQKPYKTDIYLVVI